MEYLDLDFKKYRAELMLGLVTETQDVWGEAVSDFRNEMNNYSITREKILTAFDAYSGKVEQIPPKYSAIKVDCKKLYEYARAGVDVEIKKRSIFIKDVTINEIDMDAYKVSFDVECSKGTYVRTICHDIGKTLGCGGTMSSLVRLASGVFTIDDAVSLDDLADMSQSEISKIVKQADYPLVNFGKAIINDRERADWFVNGGHIALNEVLIEREPKYALTEPPFEIRDDYKKAYNLYVEKDGEDVFLGVAFYNDKYKKLVADKVFYAKR
jgi:tRNA pseudouridine55 synthase